MDYTCITPQYWVENKDVCKNKIDDDGFWDSIPLLNCNELHDFKDNSLVRFHGMIQDMYNPEYYYDEYEVQNECTKESYIKNGRFCDTTNLAENEIINFHSSSNKTSERDTLVVISFPGLNDWAYEVEKQQQKIKKPISTNSVDAINKSTKRSLDDDEPMETENVIGVTDNKRLCVQNKDVSENLVSKSHLLNLPLSDSKGKCCLVKVYDDAELFKINEMVEVVGFLSIDPLLTDPNYHNENDSELEIQTHNPPPSLVPRIHCVGYKKLKYYNPLMKTILLNNEDLMFLRKELRVILTQLLFGDQLAADYLICHLISSVYLKNDVMTLGKFCLNLSNIPTTQHPNYGEELYEFLKLLLPKSHYLPMTLDNMNDLAFAPKKDYECNRLTSGILQLSNNTHLILDETKLQPGQLTSSGCKGVAALATIIQQQKVDYDFNYYQMAFDCDIPILTLSEGNSMLPKDKQLPLLPDDHSLVTFAEIKEAAKHFLQPELLNKFRVYLTKTRHSEYKLSDEATKLVQTAFVQLRQGKNVTGEDLHELLVLARLLCLSKGRETLDEESWNEACEMENERKRRVESRPQRK